MAKVQRIKDYRMLSRNWDIYIASLYCIPLLPKLGDHFSRGRRKTVKAIAGGGIQQNSYTDKLNRAVVSTYTSPVPAQARPYPSREQGWHFHVHP